MQIPVRIPNPVVVIERYGIGMDAMIEPTIITSFLGLVHHAFAGPVKGCIEYALLSLRSPMDADTP